MNQVTNAMVHINQSGEIAEKESADYLSFYQLSPGGLISSSDYVLLLTALSPLRRHFQITFKMFDLNRDRTVDTGRFGLMTSPMRSHSTTGGRHRDPRAPPSKGSTRGSVPTSSGRTWGASWPWAGP